MLYCLVIHESSSNEIIFLSPESDRFNSLPIAECLFDFSIEIFGIDNWELLNDYLTECGIDSPGYILSSTFGHSVYESTPLQSLDLSQNALLQYTPYTFQGTLPSIVSFLRTLQSVPIVVQSIDGE